MNGRDRGAPRSAERQPIHWAVTVERDGEAIVTLSHNHVSGRELAEEDERAIEYAAIALLGFLGKRVTIGDPHG